MWNGLVVWFVWLRISPMASLITKLPSLHTETSSLFLLITLDMRPKTPKFPSLIRQSSVIFCGGKDELKVICENVNNVL